MKKMLNHDMTTQHNCHELAGLHKYNPSYNY